MDIPELMNRLKRAADAEGLPLGERKMTFNSRLAQELSKWAETQGKGEAFHHAAFHAYLAEGINIALTPELLKMAASVGLPQEEAREVLEARLFRKAVDEDWQYARDLGIHMVPTFRIKENTLIGAQPYPALTRFMDANDIPKKDQLKKNKRSTMIFFAHGFTRISGCIPLLKSGSILSRISRRNDS